MQARVSTYRFSGENIAENIDRFRTALQATGLEDMKEAVLLIDRSSGKAISITYWEDEEAIARSRQAADTAREGAAAAGGGAVESVEEYEVALRQ